MRRLLQGSVLFLALAAGGCWALGGHDAPHVPEIEAASGQVPADLAQESWVREIWQSDSLPELIARLKLRNNSYLYLTEWRAGNGCRLVYVAGDDGGDRRYSRTTCGVLPRGDPATDRVLDLYADLPTDGLSPRFTSGSVDASAQQLRITFTECGSRTYPLDGPLVPSLPSRRVFLLDMGDCVWGKLEALRDGAVVETYESYPNAD